MSRFPESGGDDFVAARSLGVLSGNLVVNRTVNGWVGIGNSYDYFRFILDSTSLVQLLLTGLEADASLYLMDGAGALVLTSSTNAGLLNETIRQTLPIGSYQVRISRATNNTAYQLNLVTHVDLGGDDTTRAAETGLLSFTRKSYQDWIGTGDSGDYYRFMVAASGQLLLELSGLSADANLQLLDGSGLATLATSSLTGLNRERIDQTLAAGTYYARVTGPANATTRYDLNLSVRDPLLPGEDFLVQQGSINSSNKSDYYPIFLADTSNLVLLLGDLEQNANLFLYNSSGNTLLSSSSLRGTEDERIMIQLAAGNYQVRVSQGSATVATDYSLIMLARRDTGFDIPAQVFDPITLSFQIITLNGWVGKNDTHDYGGFIVTETGNVSLQLVNLDSDANLFLYNGTGSSLLASSKLSELTTDSIVQSLGMGSYMVRVSRSGNYDTRYSLLMQAEADTGNDRPEHIQTVYQVTSTPLELSGWVGTGDSLDYYRFGIDSPGHATLSLVDAESSQRLDSFSGHLQPGTYTYAVRRQGTSNTYYTLSVANEPDTNGNTPYTPTDLGTYVDTPLVYSNWIGDEDLHDYYHFAVSTLGPVTVTLSNLSQEADLFLFDASGATLLATPQIIQNTYKSLVVQLQAGDYQARVSRQGTHNSNYTLTVFQQLESQFNSNVELSDAVTNYSGWLGPGDTLDTLNFVVRNTGHVALSLLNFEADANLYLFGSNGTTLLATSLASETTTDAIHLQLTPATYQARMSRFAEQTTNYTLSLESYTETGGDSFTSARGVGTLDNSVFVATDWVGRDDTFDCYTFNLTTSGSITLQLQDLSGDADLLLYSDGGTTLLASANNRGTAWELLQTTLAAGTYHALVQSNASDNSGYTLLMLDQGTTNDDVATLARDLGSVTSSTSLQGGWIGGNDLFDWYAFSNATTGNLSLWLTDLMADGDVFLFDAADSALLAHTQGRDLDEKAILQQLTPGSYLARVTHGENHLTAYTLAVSLAADTGADLATTSSTSVGTLHESVVQKSGWVGKGDERDIYLFTVATSQQISLYLTQLYNDAHLLLLDSSGSLLAVSNNSGTEEELIVQQVTDGTYFAVVTAVANQPTQYNLSFSATADTPDAASQPLTLSDAPAGVSGWIGEGDENDDFLFIATTTGPVTLHLYGLTGNADLLLLDSQGASLLAASLNSEASSEIITRQLTPGTYRARVNRNETAATNYSLDLNQEEDTAGDSLESATPAGTLTTTPTTLTGWVGAGDSGDRFQFIVSDTGPLSLLLTHLSADAQVSLMRDSSTITTLASQGAADVPLRYQLTPGTYQARVATASNQDTSYTLYLESHNDSGGDTTLTAENLGYLDDATVTATGWLGDGDSFDYYRFSLNAPSLVSLGFAGLNEDVQLTLQNDNGTLTLSNWWNPVAIPATLGEETTFTGQLTTSDTQDDYYFTLAISGFVNLSLNGLTSDTELLLYNVDDRTLLASLPYTTEMEGLLTHQVTPGHYMARVQSPTGETTGYQLTISPNEAELEEESGEFLGLLTNAAPRAQQQLAAGDYLVRVTRVVGNSSDYTLTLNAATDQVGHSAATAMDRGTLSNTPLTSNEWIGPGDEGDDYLFTVLEDGTTELQLSVSGGGAKLFLYDEGGQLLSATVAGGVSNGLLACQLTAASYRVRVAAHDSGGSQYALSFAHYGETGGDSLTNAVDLGTITSVDTTLSGWVNNGHTLDTYRMTTDTTGLLSLRLDGLMADANLALYRTDGSLLARAARSGAGEENLQWQVTAGAYLVAVNQATSQATPYTLTLVSESETAGSSTSNALANLIQLGVGTQTGWVGDGNSLDYYSILLDATSQISLQLTGLENDANLLLQTSTTTLAVSSRSGQTAESIEQQLAPGTYYCRVSRGTAVNSHYALVMDLTQEGDNNTRNSQEVLQDSVNGWLGSGDSDDYYRFQVTDTGNVTLNLTNLEANIDLLLYRADSSTLLATSQPSDTGEFLTWQLTPNSYLARVTRTGTISSHYTLSLTGDTDSDGVLGDLTPQGEEVSGWVGGGDTLDAFRFTLAYTGSVYLLLNHLSADANLSLYNGTGSILLAASSLSGDQAETIRQQLTPGSYQARVTGVGSQAAYYDLALSQQAENAGNTFSSAADIGFASDAGATWRDWVGSGNSADFYRFSLATASTLTVLLQDMDGDAHLALYQGGAASLIASSQRSGSQDEMIRQNLSAGSYTLQVTRATNSASHYALTLAALVGGEDNTTTTANPLGSLTADYVTNTGWVGMGDVDDYYHFSISHTGNVELLLDDLTADANLTLYSASGATLASSRNTGTNAESIRRQLTPEEYFLRISPSATSATHYTLEANHSQETGGDSLATATPLARVTPDLATISGWVGSGDSHDYYRLPMDATGYVFLSLKGLQADANLFLLNSSGSTLLSSTQGGNREENIQRLLPLGDYGVRVTGMAQASTTYALTWYQAPNLGILTTANTQVVDELALVDKVHYFQFAVDAPGHVNMTLSELDDNANLYLYNAEGTTLLASSTLQGLLRQEINIQLAPNIYLAKLVLTGQSISDYRLALNHTPDSGGNTTTLATNLGVLSQPVSLSDWVGQGDTHDYYLFETDGNGHVSLALEELTGDASLFLYNSSGNTLLASSTLSGLSDEAIDIQLTPATYLAKVSRVGTSAVQYSLSMSSEEETAGTTTESALMVGSLTDVAFTLTGWVGNRNTYDYYRLIVDNLGQMDLTLDGLSGDANLALFNGAGNSQLALSQNSGTTAESIDQQVAAGTYLVRVARGSNSTASYSLGLLAWGETEGNLGTLSDSPSLANGWVGAGDTLDAFPFFVNTAGVVSLGLTGLDGNADVLLTNASGSSLLASSTLTGSLDEEIHILLTSGSYQARVVRGSNASSRYDLSLSLASDAENLPLGTLSADPVSVTGWLGTGDSYDNYYFVVSQWGDVTLTLSNLRQNANLQLYSSSNSLLSSSTLAGTANDVIQYGVSAGTYLAQVVRATSGYTDYNLLLSYSEDTGGSMLTTPVSLGTLSPTPACVSGWVGGGDSVDYYRFVTDALGHVSLTLGNLTGDANLYLYDLVSGSVLASSTLSQTSNETILRQLASGTYVAAVTRGSGSGSRYALSATLTEENGSDTLADAPQVATLSASATTITGWVGEGDSNDFFRFVMDTTGAATLKLSGLAGDANLYLHQDNGSLLISSTLTGSSSEIIASQLTPATYVVRVGRSGTANTSYTLTMSSEAENADNDLGNLTEDNIRVGYVSPEDGQDIYLFVMATTSHTTLLLSGLADDADLMLFSMDTVLLDSTTAQTTPDRTLQRQLAPGSYYVAVVNSNTEGSTDYQLAIQLASDQGGDSLADALNLGTPNGTLNSQGWLGVGDSVDYYRFAITRNTMVTLGLSGQLDVAGLYLMDGQGGATLATTTANGQSSPTIDLQLSAGSYAIRINSVTTSSNYQLDLSLTADAGEATSTARALGSLAYAPVTLTSWIGPQDPYDYYKFALSSRRRVNFLLGDLSGSADLKLLSADGSVVLAYPRYSGNQDEIISMELAAGSYYAVVVGQQETLYSLVVDADQDLSGSDMYNSQDLGSMREDTVLDGWVGNGDLSDIYRFYLPSTSTLSLNVEDVISGLGVGLFNSTGYIVLPQSYYSQTYDGGIHQQVSPGNYFIRTLRNIGDNDYTLRVEVNPESYGDSFNHPFELGVLTNPRVEVGSLNYTDEQDIYRFEMANTNTVTINLFEISQLVDVDLLDSSGQRILASINAFSTTGEYSVERRLGAGTYYVRVKRDGQDTSYHLRLFNSPQNPQNLGALLNSGRQVWDWVGNGDREDFYSFSLTATSNMSIILNEQSGDLDLQLLDYAHWQERAFADTLLNWLDHQGENVLASSRTPGLVEESINQVLAPGTYYVSVLPRQGNSNYHLALQATTTSSPVTVESPDYATSVLSLGNLQGNQVVRGSVGDEDVMDCYGFTITSSRTVSLVLEELTADAELYLLRGLDWSPSQPDDTFTAFMDNWDAQVVARRESLSNREVISNIHLSTGTYFVAVRQGSGETSYSLSLLTTTATAAPGLVHERREVHESPMLALG